ncbi:MAG: hypothetical protein IPL07_16365 [Acidimicrobiaceae bacterium]|nr:hypothetical protein [Acidimicrobiaceae bacterium]
MRLALTADTPSTSTSALADVPSSVVPATAGTSRSLCGSAIDAPPTAVVPSSGSGAVAGAAPRVGAADGDPGAPAASGAGP